MKRADVVVRAMCEMLAALALVAGAGGAGRAGEAPEAGEPGFVPEVPGARRVLGMEELRRRPIRQLPPGAVGLPVGMTDRGAGTGQMVSAATGLPAYPWSAMPVEVLAPLPPSSFEEYASLATDPTGVTRLEQFGYEHFLRAPSTFAPVADVPVGPDYLLGPGDEVVVTIWGRVERRDIGTISREGTLALPVVGVVPLSGVRFGRLRDLLRTYYNRHYVGYELEVSLKKLRTIAVHVVGAARRPGTYELGATSTIFSALSAAAGPTKNGSTRRVRLLRGGELISELDLYDLFLTGNAPGDERLMSGDVVFVPRVGPLVAVGGAVRSPGIYELEGEGAALAEVIEHAGGLAFEAAPSRVHVERVGEGERIVLESVDLSRDEAGSVRLHDGDIVRVQSVPMKLQSVVYLEGNIARPGRRGHWPGMKVSDLLAGEEFGAAEFWSERRLGFVPGSQESLAIQEEAEAAPEIGIEPATGEEEPGLRDSCLPEDRRGPRLPRDEAVPYAAEAGGTEALPSAEGVPAAAPALPQPPRRKVYEVVPKPYWEFALVRRITSPDLEEVLIPFNLRKALARDPVEDVELQPQDTVIIYAESDFRPAEVVRSAGALEKPGTFRFSAGMTVRDLVAISGGLTRDAYLKSAELTRTYLLEDGVRAERTEIDLEKALVSPGPSVANPVLKRDDYLFIRRLPDAMDSRTVSLEGEFGFAGTYQIRPGERLSEVIERAGGFTEDAYLRGAVFLRESTREIQQAQLDKAIADLEAQNIAMAEAAARTAGDPELTAAVGEAAARRRATVERLRSAKAQGRIVVALSPARDLRGTADDLVLEAGDRLTVPTAPSTVTVMGSVYASTAVVYRPGHTVAAYIAECGGTTPNADDRNIFVLRADGSVVSRRQRGLGGFVWREKDRSWAVRDLLAAAPSPGDVVMVPEKLEPRTYPGKFAKDLIDVLYKVAIAAAVFIAP